MTVFSTYCSAEKDTSEGLLPAIDRYRSGRIGRIYSAALSAGVGFRILSGEFGLIGPADMIPFYDHLLQFDEIESLTARVIGQMVRDDIDRVFFFTLSPKIDPLLRPYHELLRRSCAGAGAGLELVEIDFA